MISSPKGRRRTTALVAGVVSLAALVGSSATAAGGTLAGTGSAGGMVTGATGSAGGGMSADRWSVGEPPLRLVAGSTDITLERVPEYGVDLDLGTHLVAGRKPIEVRATRASYDDPIVARQIVDGWTKRLPTGMVTDFAGLAGFLHVRITDAQGKKVLDRDQTVCLNGEGSRIRPDAPDTSPYPDSCVANPFTLGAVWGLQAGWSVNTFDHNQPPVDLAAGKYRVEVGVAKAYRDHFRIGAKDSSVTLNLTVKDAPNCGGEAEGCRSAAEQPKTLRPADAEQVAAERSSGQLVSSQPNASRPTGKGRVPRGPKPDLRALPAWQITVAPGEEGTPTADRDFLQFSANVWNAGPSTLVIDGFRRHGEDLMDAYQYFYDADGRQIGYQKTGTMEWDPRDGHHHWHFTDFARYSLLKADGGEAVRSQKEAFCLAATDAIDYTVKNANWHPSNTDLHTACGSQGSLSVREVLDVGSGDTYVQSLPGQSFDITDLPNGTYYIQIVANPEKRLFETTTDNNESLRKVVLGGTKHHRTVTVPPVGLIDVP